jgi:glycosyltransferase involved in cell wall biosynthesis
MPRIAAIIPTHNRAGFLEACLTSVCEQDIDPAVFEICIVNNCCTDATPEIVTRITAKYPHLNIFMVEEPKLGLSNARNCGVASTTAPLIAFGDDDATMPPDWLGRFLTRFDELGETVGKVGGQIDPVWGAPRPDWLIDRMLSMLSASAGHGTEAKFSDYPIVECNSCYRRSALIEAGGFPKNLGRIGTSLLSNDLTIHKLLFATLFTRIASLQHGSVVAISGKVCRTMRGSYTSIRTT